MELLDKTLIKDKKRTPLTRNAFWNGYYSGGSRVRMKINITAVAVFTLSGAVLAQPFVERIGKYPSKQEAFFACLDWAFAEDAPTYQRSKTGHMVSARKCVDDSLDPPNRRRGKGEILSGEKEDPTLSGNRVFVGFEPFPEEVRDGKGWDYRTNCKSEQYCKATRYFRW